jgi:hypothetical protein
MAELLIGFIDKARDLPLFLDEKNRPVLFKSLFFDVYCKNISGSDSRLKKWEDPYKKASQLSPSDRMKKDAWQNYADVARRVQKGVFGIEKPIALGSSDQQCRGLSCEGYLDSIPENPFPRVAA